MFNYPSGTSMTCRAPRHSVVHTDVPSPQTAVAIALKAQKLP